MALPLYDLINNINKQIKSICCKIEGSGTNIYNSDGTLTGNRTLSGANNDLTFADLNIFKISVGGNDNGLNIDFARDIISLGSGSDINNAEFKGLYIANSLNVLNPAVIIGDFDSINPGNLTNISVIDFFSTIKTQYGGNEIGLKLDFANQQYIFGNVVNSYGYIQDDINGIIKIGDPLGTFGGYNNFNIDYQNSVINTQSAGNDIGLKLDFANGSYLLGDFNINSYINVTNSGSGIEISNPFGISIGDLNPISPPSPVFGIIPSINTIKTQYGGNDIGLKLDFANSTYQFGQITGGNAKTFAIDDTAAFGFQFSGTGITQGTTGSASGQYLKVNVGGTDYVIELNNPS